MERQPVKAAAVSYSLQLISTVSGVQGNRVFCGPVTSGKAFSVKKELCMCFRLLVCVCLCVMERNADVLLNAYKDIVLAVNTGKT